MNTAKTDEGGNEIVRHEPPDDAVVLASVERVEVRVLAGIRIDRNHARRIRIGVSVVAGLGLFAGGVVVGAAALRPAPNPESNSSTFVDGDGVIEKNVFAIDCGTSTSSGTFVSAVESVKSAQSKQNAGERADERDPAGVCARMTEQSAVSDAIGVEVKKLVARGIDHGFIQISGDRTYHFQATSATKTSGLSYEWDDGEETIAPGIAVTATIPSPITPQPRQAVCAVASNWVKVYPAGRRSAAEVCGSLGLAVWVAP